MDEIKEALRVIIYYNPLARKDLNNKDACKRCADARDRIIELLEQSEPKVATIYKEMKKRGTKTGCSECVDLGNFSIAYLLLLELGEKYSDSI
ncbi:MAG: hypothetical protein V1900_01325 [Candidatus Aenigmatarchaeota archaeon]